MLQYLLKKLLLMIPTLAILAVVIFALMRFIPGDPAVLLVGDLEDPAVLEEARRQLGLDQPYYVQFGAWVGNVLNGNFGVSLMTGEDVLQAMAKRFAVTAKVVLLAVALAALIAIPAGLFAAWRQNRAGDFAVVLTMNLCLSIPSFWAGLMLIMLFGVKLNWLPTLGYVSGDVWAGLRYLILPVISLVLVEVATITRMMRASTIEVLRQEYVTHARAKGLSEAVVLFRHVLRNALAPTVTLLGLILGSLLGGAVVIETVFTLPGLGRFLVEAIYARDYAVVQGVLILVALIYIVVNLLVDLIYPLLDPRVRL